MGCLAHEKVAVEVDELQVVGCLPYAPDLPQQSRFVNCQEVVLDALLKKRRSEQDFLVLPDPPRVDNLAPEQRQQLELALRREALPQVQLHGSRLGGTHAQQLLRQVVLQQDDVLVANWLSGAYVLAFKSGALPIDVKECLDRLELAEQSEVR